MSKGYIKIHRKILDNGVFENGDFSTGAYGSI